MVKTCKCGKTIKEFGKKDPFVQECEDVECDVLVCFNCGKIGGGGKWQNTALYCKPCARDNKDIFG